MLDPLLIPVPWPFGLIRLYATDVMRRALGQLADQTIRLVTYFTAGGCGSGLQGLCFAGLLVLRVECPHQRAEQERDREKSRD